MLSLRDFFHLPQVDPIIDQLTHDGSGLILVAGMDPRAHAQTTDAKRFLSSGRAGIFRILVRQILEVNPTLKATIVAGSRDAFRVPRGLVRRVRFELLDSPEAYAELIPTIARLHPGLLVVDQLTPENATVVLAAAQDGIRVISQMDSVFRGAEVIRVLLSWGIPRGRLSGLRWVVAMQRIPLLCQCKAPVLPGKDLINAIQHRYPHLVVNTMGDYFAAGSCTECEHTGRRNEITAFDFFRADPDTPFDQPSLYPLEAYLLGLAESGLIPLSDLLRIESDQLHRIYQLLTTSEGALADATNTLERKVIELEAANRVLRNRTEELISLQEIGQALIGTKTLRDLARQVCRQASALCGADRAIFYFLRDEKNAEVLATHGWEPGRVPQRVSADQVCDPGHGLAPDRYNGWPPGVKSRHPDLEGARLRAGLRVPLVSQGDPVGAMIVHSTTKSRFQPGAVALLQTFANQAAIAIQRASLIESLQGKVAQLEAAQKGLAQKERLERELELAREVQQALLPRTFPQVTGYHFAARNEPARQVGGDFFDVIDLGSNHFGVVVADVSDKGMPAAVYMALTRSVMVAEAHRATSPVAVLQNVNELLLELGQARMFVTVFYGIVDVSTRSLTYARAGHDRPVLIRDREVQELSGDGIFLGFLGSEDLHLTEESIKLEPGDRLVLFTDGLTDTTSPQGRRFDRKGLHHLLKEIGQLPAKELCDIIFNTLVEYQGTTEQFDDMTLLVVEVT
jgi:sigma-B regulation protein RsbU (phosphoserine phosphatase)